MAGKKIDRLSLSSRSLKHKMIIAFQLMSILPLLISFYLVSNYILPKFGLKLDIIATVVSSIFVALVGLLVIKEVFDRISSVSCEAKLIAAGDINRQLHVEHGDEVGELSNVLNQLTQRIRNNMDELKNYSEKTSAINLEIQKKVMVLSSLMQISALISEGSRLDDILKVVVQKSRSLANSDAAFLLFRDEPQGVFYMKVSDGLNMDYLSSVKIAPKEELYQKGFNLNRPLVLDRQSSLSGQNLTLAFYEKFRLKNSLTMPVFLKDKIKAVLGIGSSRESFVYSKDDIELLDIFSKQISIAIENDLLSRKVEKLEVKDALTGLYNEPYIRCRLQEEIKRAISYQRPCALIIFDIDNFKRYYESFGLIAAEEALKKIALVFKDSVTEIDRVGRIGDDEFAVVLPERNKRQAQEIAEQMRRKVEFSYSEEPQNRRIAVSAGVSENPLDGVEVAQLIAKAKDLLAQAKESGRNRVAAF